MMNLLIRSGVRDQAAGVAQAEAVVETGGVEGDRALELGTTSTSARR